MPLAFESLSHGTISFGFFNIESDMLLLDSHFFFSTEFCARVVEMAESRSGVEIAGYTIDDADAIGNLMGAIHGVAFTGFIGALYRLYPFPDKPEEFRQNPRGTETEGEVRLLIERFGRPLAVEFSAEGATGEVVIGDYRFDRDSFHELIRYVWRGGYPRWKNDSPPPYVRTMAAAIVASGHRVFDGVSFPSRP